MNRMLWPTELRRPVIICSALNVLGNFISSLLVCQAVLRHLQEMTPVQIGWPESDASVNNCVIL